MDAVAELTSKGTTGVMDILVPTALAFRAVIEQNVSVVTDVRRETFKYGNEDRHQLDVYYPPTKQTEKTPIFFWIYGGGFVNGERVLPPPLDLSYPCVGAFFARQGFITVIPDYRLASPPTSAAYPKAAEDVRDAITWTVANQNELVSPTTPNPDTDSIFILGHSAGANHVGTLLLDPNVLSLDSPLRSKIKGAILMAGLYYNDPRSGFEPETKLYYGDKLETHSVLALVNSAKDNGINLLPKILLAEAEHEPEVFKDVRKKFQDVLNSFLQQQVQLVIAKDHNHISIGAALSSGQGEEWALEVSEWIRSNV